MYLNTYLRGENGRPCGNQYSWIFVGGQGMNNLIFQSTGNHVGQVHVHHEAMTPEASRPFVG